MIFPTVKSCRKLAVFGGLLLLSWVAPVTQAQLTSAAFGFSGGSITSSDTGFLNTFQLTVPSGSGKITDLNLRLSILYPILQELTIQLVHQDTGTAVTLLDNVTGASDPQNGANFQDTLLDDSAGSPQIGTAPNNTAPFPGPNWPGGKSYRPQSYGDPNSQLSRFNNEDAAGTWVLNVKAYRLYADAPTGTLLANGDSAFGGTVLGTGIILTTVPEPQAYALVFGGILLGCAVIRRRSLRV